MSKICVKCGFENTATTIKPTSACPSCGVIYWKAEKLANITEKEPEVEAPIIEPPAIGRKRKQKPVIKLSHKILAGLLVVFAFQINKIVNPPPPPERSYGNTASTDCSKGTSCWKEKEFKKAFSPCNRMIESWAKFDYDWTDSILGERPRYREGVWGMSSNILVFTGSEIKFQNAFDVWVPYSYACHWNIDTQSVEKVNVFQ